MPERFTFKKHIGNCWSIGGPGVDKPMTQFSDSRKWWAFIGPLADELRVLGDDITSQEKQPDGRYLSGFLEATFAAVCKKMEANR
jgi:hypothetical protein